MVEITLYLVCAVALYQAVDIFQRRQIDGIDAYRATQATQLKYRYDSCLRNIDRMMLNLIKTEKELSDLSQQTVLTAGEIEDMVADLRKGLEQVNEQAREEFFIRKAISRLPYDKS